MSIINTTLLPGLLVGISTRIKGNVQYDKVEISAETTTATGAAVAAWETTRTIFDPAEHDEAVKVRSKARSLIASVCIPSEFGMLCPESRSDDLTKAVADARALCDTFNRNAKLTVVKFFAITGRIASNDVEAVKAINSEVRELLDEMKEGVDKLDVEVIRKASARAKKLGGMLPSDANERVLAAVKVARDAASNIVKAGDQAAVEVDKTVVEKLAAARTAFLDLDGADEVQAPVETSGRALDLTPHAVVYDRDNATGEFGAASNFKPAKIEMDA